MTSLPQHGTYAEAVKHDTCIEIVTELVCKNCCVDGFRLLENIGLLERRGKKHMHGTSSLFATTTPCTLYMSVYMSV